MVGVCFFLSACATPRNSEKPFNVTLEVDFGPTDRPAMRRMVQVEPGSTPQQATAKACSLQSGAVCCDNRETAGIDGVMADPAGNYWWTVSVNGSKKNVSPFKTRLKPGDVVHWEYRKYDQ